LQEVRRITEEKGIPLIVDEIQCGLGRTGEMYACEQAGITPDLMPIAKSIGARECVSDSKLGKVSVIGTGMQNTPGYAARMFRVLSEKGINIQLITTSEIRITVIIEESRVIEAVRALHRAFELDTE